jgi:UDP-glucose 4-epimerase
MSLQGKIILVTGGCGLIGSTLVDQLLAEDGAARVRVLDNLTRGSLDNLGSALATGRCELVRADIRDFHAIRPHFDGVDTVFHLAAIRITACAAQPRDCQDVLVTGTFNVVQAAHEARVRRFIASSSASVYGLAEQFPTPETHHPYNNRTWYGAAKAANEGLYRSFHDMHGFPYIALRYFNVYGPRMDVFGKYTEVLIRWLEALDRGEAPLIHGDGSTTVDWVYVDDVARANRAAAQSEIVDRVYNIAEGRETSLRQTLDALLRATGHTAVVPRHEPPRGVNAVPRRWADVSRARDELGWSAQIGLEEGLRRLVAWRRVMLSTQAIVA